MKERPSKVSPAEEKPDTMIEFRGTREGVIFTTDPEFLPVVIGGRRQIIVVPTSSQTKTNEAVKQDASSI